MPAWFYVVAAAAVAFVFWYGWARRWWHGLRYGWTRARHLADLTQTEVIPGGEYIPYVWTRSRPPWEVTGPDWREQTAAELSPEALDECAHEGEPHTLTECLDLPPIDPGPGGGGSDVVSSPPSGPDHSCCCHGGTSGEHECCVHPGGWLDYQLADLFAWVREVHALLAAS